MTVMTFLESLRALLYTNQPQALVAIKYGIVNIINIRVNILSNCEANGHLNSEYLTVQHIGKLILSGIKLDKLYRLTKFYVFGEGTVPYLTISVNLKLQ